LVQIKCDWGHGLRAPLTHKDGRFSILAITVEQLLPALPALAKELKN
jgi:hypothetical protein